MVPVNETSLVISDPQIDESQLNQWKNSPQKVHHQKWSRFNQI